MDIASLRAFIAVAELGSFSRAAVRLHLTQPAISKRIVTLEQSVGFPLFDRNGRQVCLTEPGRTLLPHARRIINEIEDSLHAIANLSTEISGPLRVGTSHHIGLHRLPPIIRNYLQSYPEVELKLTFLDSEQVSKQVAQGLLDLGVITLPQQQSPQLEQHPVWQDRLVVVAAADHPLQQLTLHSPAQLTHHTAILPMTGTTTRLLIDQGFARYGSLPQHVIDINFLETIKMMVEVGLGWSLLPISMVDAGVVALPQAELLPLQIERPLGVVTRHGFTLSNAAQAIYQLLQTIDG